MLRIAGDNPTSLRWGEVKRGRGQVYPNNTH
jgi:hypothetical protein